MPAPYLPNYYIMPPFKPRNGCIPIECLAKADLASNCVRIIMSGKLTGRSCLRVFIYFILIVERSELWSVCMRMMQARLFVECCRAFFLTLWMQAEPRAIFRLQVTNRLATLNSNPTTQPCAPVAAVSCIPTCSVNGRCSEAFGPSARG
jgi:hypothetical protein